LLPPLQPIINWQNTNPRIGPSERDNSLALFPVVNFLSYGSFCMVKRKWVRFGIIPIGKKFGQVLEGVYSGEGGSAGLPWTSMAFHCKETLSGRVPKQSPEKLGFSSRRGQAGVS